LLLILARHDLMQHSHESMVGYVAAATTHDQTSLTCLQIEAVVIAQQEEYLEVHADEHTAHLGLGWMNFSSSWELYLERAPCFGNNLLHAW
jgi:hypothetical protein